MTAHRAPPPSPAPAPQPPRPPASPSAGRSRGRRSWLSRLLLALLVAVAVLAVAAVMFLRRSATPGFTERALPVAMTGISDQALAGAFAPSQQPVPRAAYESVFRYAFEGFLAYRTPLGAAAHYPGLPSSNGRRSDGMEAFARMFPVAGSWLAAGRPDRVTAGGKELSLAAVFRQGVLAGTDPAGPEHWGDIEDNDQRIVEAADIALGLWLSRRQIWERLTDGERQQIARWLARGLQVEVYDGNWELFPTMVHTVLRALGVDTRAADERARTRYEHFKSSYRGNGWFFDPPNGFDYYNAWSIHYELFWLDRIDPSFDPAFIRKTSAEFSGFIKHAFGPHGYPMMGRSSCYRMAATAPLLAATQLAPEQVSPGEATRALDATWRYFMQRDAMRDGTVTAGFCGTNLELVANYSGPASCLWALRSLIVALYLDDTAGRLLDSPRQKLPVELGDFELASTPPGWTLVGRQASGDVDLLIAANPADAQPALNRYGPLQRFAEWITRKPRRPDNHAALYGRGRYSTEAQPVACAAAAR